ncbi:2-amino-4-hydroxy-6-hydroxymethyldihydropteridine diphosphokinase [bacterium]|nr:2-amino-4-hydroxy-6-hydroxymethyldihydropteridine diphosphokinase [bacterium]
MTRSLIAFGANLGPAARTFHDLINHLAGEIPAARVLASPLYLTPPVGTENQSLGRPFINGVYLVDSSVDPIEIFQTIRRSEQKFGEKDRSTWSPRSIDLDLVWSDGPVIDTQPLILPHPRMHYRWFVLKPACDLMASAIHPILKLPIADLLERVTQRAPRFIWLGKRGATLDRIASLIQQRLPDSPPVDCLDPSEAVAFFRLGVSRVGIKLDYPPAREATWVLVDEEMKESASHHSREGITLPAVDLRHDAHKSVVQHLMDFLDSLKPGQRWEPTET